MTNMEKTCIAAILDHIAANPNCVADQFCDGTTDDDARIAENWRPDPDLLGYMDDDEAPGAQMYAFNCEPYDDQLRAYVAARGSRVVSVLIQGE